MATNNYFGNKLTSFPQQELLNSLTREVIKMNGIDVLYLPRSIINKDTLLGEDASSKFENAYEVEMYINTVEGFGGGNDALTKFGLDVQDELILIVNKERFYIECGIPTPREGDIIYLPLSKGMFEVKFVEDEKPFYSLGKNTVYELTCETFVYSEEKFEIAEESSGKIFDKVERDHAITITLTTESSSDKYTLDEEVYQGSTLATATAKGIVASFTSTTIKVFNVVGTFSAGTETVPIPIIGNTSLTSRNLTKVDDQDLDTAYADNKEYEIEGDSILDFSETDPWSEGDL
jgi:hypothetical protein